MYQIYNKFNTNSNFYLGLYYNSNSDYVNYNYNYKKKPS